MNESEAKAALSSRNKPIRIWSFLLPLNTVYRKWESLWLWSQWWVKLQGAVWRIWSRWALERELVSPIMRPLVKSKSFSSVISVVGASASQISYLFWLKGIPICVCPAGHLNKKTENSAANKCTIPRRGLFVCLFFHLLLKGTISQNITVYRGQIGEWLRVLCLKSKCPNQGLLGY